MSTFDQVVSRIALGRIVKPGSDLTITPEEAGVLFDGITLLQARLDLSERERKADRDVIETARKTVRELLRDE